MIETMRMMRFGLVLVVLVAVLASSLCAGEVFQAEVADISGSAYLPAVEAALHAATGSVVVAMYQVRLAERATHNQPVARLVGALVAAQERGVAVRVILDRSFRYAADKRTHKRNAVSDTAAGILREAGAEVKFGTAGRALHAKVIVIDGATVITGSHNWTHYALTRNTEHAVLIRSAGHAGATLRVIDGIKTEPRTELPPDLATHIRVPVALLTDPALAPQMLSSRNERAFDLYMALLRYAHEKAADGASAEDGLLEVDYARLAADLGMEMEPLAYRRQITKTLRKLQDEYALLNATFGYGQPATVKLTGPAADEDTLSLPLAYWTYGVGRQLPLTADVAYLIVLSESARSATAPRWSASREALSERYAIPSRSIGIGLVELERRNILEITRHPYPTGQSYAMRPPNTYCLRPFRSEAEQKASWEALREKHGDAPVSEARKLAAMIDRPHHPTTVKDLLYCITTYGLPATQAATARVAALHLSNPMRHPGYIITILKGTVKSSMESNENGESVNENGNPPSRFALWRAG
ncbi:MAG: hypothetical protein HN383_18105 [Verrucomicrobia bacterium]|jgi:hypothetical protein|nr:hypothetical protein [Verrucomicrobiota bacterium]